MAGPYGTPRTWSAGERPTAAQFNAEFRDWITALANPPWCRVYHSVNQSIAHATETTLAFNSEDNDTDAMHDTAVNNSRITFNKAGLYVVSADIPFERATDYTHTYVNIRLNAGATSIVTTSDGTSTINADADLFHNPFTPYKFAAGDFVDVRVFHRNGASAARNINARTANRQMFFTAVRIGNG